MFGNHRLKISLKDYAINLVLSNFIYNRKESLKECEDLDDDINLMKQSRSSFRYRPKQLVRYHNIDKISNYHNIKKM